MKNPIYEDADLSVIEPEAADRARELEALRQAMMRTWWWICLALWLSVGTLSLWWLRSEFQELREYFTWAALRAMIIFNRPASLGLMLCVGLTLALLISESRHILWGLSKGERSRLAAQLDKIHTQGSSHPQWKIVYPTEVQSKE
ncbi:MAG: hypothetical protein WBB01_07180 [Phormidesmis sp.]